MVSERSGVSGSVSYASAGRMLGCGSWFNESWNLDQVKLSCRHPFPELGLWQLNWERNYLERDSGLETTLLFTISCLFPAHSRNSSLQVPSKLPAGTFLLLVCCCLHLYYQLLFKVWASMCKTTFLVPASAQAPWHMVGGHALGTPRHWIFSFLLALHVIT